MTLTLQAATALAQRFNEERPSYTTHSRQSRDEQAVPRQDSVNHRAEDSTERQGLKQDHHYKREEENATSEPAKQADLGVQQEKPARYPTADGTIPPYAAPVDSATPSAPALEIAQQPTDEAPLKDPVEHQSAGEIKPASSSQSTTGQTQQKTETIPRQEAVPEQEEVPEGINTDIFHSPRVAELLGNKPKDGRAKRDMALSGAKKTPVDQTNLHQGKDQDTFNVRKSRSTTFAGSDAKDHAKGSVKTSSASSEEMQDFAADLAKDAQATTTQPEVSSP